jgi:glycosyltransferase involved in cell wall biosynthesis
MWASSVRSVRVLVDARIIPGESGGVETVLRGLAQGLSTVDGDGTEVTFLTYSGVSGWIEPYLGGEFKLQEVPIPGVMHRVRRRARMWRIRRAAGSFAFAPRRDSVLDGHSADVVHFPLQSSHQVKGPFIYQPHDLQHRHLPDLFTPRAMAYREVVYPRICRRAAAVAVGTSWVKHDVVSQLGIDPARVHVVPLAPLSVTSLGPGRQVLRGRDLPKKYIVYPAVAWPHKNHERLIRSLALLRRHGLEVPLVLTGGGRDRSALGALAARYGVADLVTDLGYLAQDELEIVMSNAIAMVVPTLFESASFPVWEAFQLGVPVACSRVTSLPRQVGDAGVLFDPRSVTDMTEAVARIWTDPILRKDLIARGHSRVSEFTWELTARHFLALYRQVAGAPLSREDRALIEGEPLL